MSDDAAAAMSYRDLLRLEGGLSALLGMVFVGVALPGLEWSTGAAALGLAASLVAVGVAVLGARRFGGRLSAPGSWFTSRALATAERDGPSLPAAPLTRRLVLETALWLPVAALVLAFTSRPWLAFVTGLLSVGFGANQAGPARTRVADVERERGVRFRIARRRALGTPALSFDGGPPG